MEDLRQHFGNGPAPTKGQRWRVDCGRTGRIRERQDRLEKDPASPKKTRQTQAAPASKHKARTKTSFLPTQHPSTALPEPARRSHTRDTLLIFSMLRDRLRINN